MQDDAWVRIVRATVELILNVVRVFILSPQGILPFLSSQKLHVLVQISVPCRDTISIETLVNIIFIVHQDPREDWVLREVIVRSSTESVYVHQVIKVGDLPLEPLLSELSFLEDPSRLHSVKVLQIATLLIPLSDHFLRKLVPIIPRIEV